MGKNHNSQLELALIDRNVNEDLIQQRLMDGYINATALCKASEKQLSHYLENGSTKAFLEELSSDIGIPITELVQIIKGGTPQLQGTWVHPQVAINLGQWASPKFAVMVSKWVTEWMTGSVPKTNKLPYHLQRYMINRTGIPPTHFSILNEITYNLIAPLEDDGYELPDRLVPDISEGRMFAKWVRDEMGLEPNDLPTYTQTYPDGRVIPGVKLYPNFLLGDFREHFYNVWLRTRAAKYFEERDVKALPHLIKIVAALPAPNKEHVKATLDIAKKQLRKAS
jgi:hypothetical protein